MELPPRAPNPNPFQDFAGGGYFYLDNQDRAVVPTTERHVLVIGLENGEFEVEQDYDLTGTLPVGLEDHLGAARLVGADLARHDRPASSS